MRVMKIEDLLGREVTNKDYYNIKEIVIADNVKCIYPSSIYKFRKLTSITIPNGVRVIEEYAFGHCRHLKSIYISKSVEKIDVNAFWGCFEIESIIIDEENEMFDSRNNCNAIISTKDNILLHGCKNTFIPNGVKKISDRAFRFAGEINSIRLPESLHYFSINTFKNRDCIKTIEVDENNTIFDSRNNCNAIIRKNTNALIYGCKNSVIPYGVEIIDYRAFEGCTSLSSIIIPESVKIISEKAFENCVKLSSITIPDGVEIIGAKAFADCGRLEEIKISNSVKKICNQAFCGCISLSSIIIPEGIKTLGMGVFSACSNLETVKMPKSLENIEIDDREIPIFQYCKKLKRIVIPKGYREKYESILPEYMELFVEE